jgi:hypothetical protein
MVLIGLALLGLYGYRQRDALGQWAFDQTGEEEPASQARALWHLALQAVSRPALDLQPDVPIEHNGVNPFGINTFLQQEVEESKRERQVQLIAEAGFKWVRQEFPWADIEISAKGNFDDCRNNGQCISAWKKYDHIVGLAEKYGLNIVVRLSSPPDWSRADGQARGAFAPPDNVADFADYAEAVARRYSAQLRYFQVWNEPNIYPEWGDQPANPEQYTDLLCQTYRRLKQVNPDIVVLSGVLAPTNQLGDINPVTTQAAEINDFIYLQRMYAAGAKGCFDVLTVQGYGLFSGPTDGRNRPLVVNYGRNQFIRDLMVKNGDAHKAIWIAEMNWNVAPENIPPDFGRVTEAQQARYAPLAYQRQQAEWPWVGVNMLWFFKLATDANKDQPMYYFRLADPDFTLRPIYYAMKEYANRPPAMYPGWFQEGHWAVQWQGEWREAARSIFTFSKARKAGAPGDSLRLTFHGTDLELLVFVGPEAGSLMVHREGTATAIKLHADAMAGPRRVTIARNLPEGLHTVEIINQDGLNVIDGFIVRSRRASDSIGWLVAGMLGTLSVIWLIVRRNVAAR